MDKNRANSPRVLSCLFGFLRQIANISCARCKKYSSKLDIFRSFVANLRFARIYPALALKNIEASFIFFARLWLICASREYSLWGGKPHSFGNINVPSSQATLISRCRFKKYRSKLHIFRSLVVNLRFARI